MLTNYLKIALRNLIRHKGYSFINIAGLAIGMAACLLIMLYVSDQLLYEQFHKNKDQIYRVVAELNFGGRIDKIAAIMGPLGPRLAEEYPEVVDAVRFSPASPGRNPVLSFGQDRYKEENFFFVDPSVFDVFTFPLIKGDPKTALKDPFSLVITEDIGAKYFGSADPMGKVLTLDDRHDFTVTGVLQNIPRHTQLKGEFMASFSSLDEIRGQEIQHWMAFGTVYNYIRVAEGFSVAEFEAKLPEFVKKNIGEQFVSSLKLNLQPLSKIFLHSDLLMELSPSGNIGYVYLFSALAALILLIASINFMNLATARSTHRAKEVSMRKVLGAYRFQLVKQFLGESIVFSLIALIFALALFEFIKPEFSSFLGQEMSIDYGRNFLILPGLIGLAIIVGALAGAYPAFFLARFKTLKILKGASPVSAKSLLRKSLVVFQFAISIVLLIGTMVIYKQLDYVKNENLGFDKEHVMVIPMENREISQQYAGLKNELLQNPGVVNVSGAFSIPASGPVRKITIKAEGVSEEEPLPMQGVAADYDYLTTLGLEITAGRDFSKEFGTDASEAYILNQAAAKRLGWDDPIGREFAMPTGHQTGDLRSGQVIGVVKDFHMQSLRQKIEPLFIYIDPMMLSRLAVRIGPGNISETVASIEQTWQKFAPNTAFEFSFVDQNFAKLYRAEDKLGQLLTAFSLLAVFVACLGLFGLAAFSAEQRTKEIGIRKVLGASISGIVMLLSKEFVILILIANIFAFPLAWYAMDKWLQDFAYRISLGWGAFALAGFLAFAIALLTVSFQALKAAVANPVKAIGYE